MERFLWIVSVNLLLVCVVAGSLNTLRRSSFPVRATESEVVSQPSTPQVGTESPEVRRQLRWVHLWEGLPGDLLVSAFVAMVISAYAYAVWGPSRTADRQAAVGTTARNEGVGLEVNGPSLEPVDKGEQGVVVQTIIGPLRFSTTHEVGRLGDYLCHLYFNGHDTAKIYSRLPAKRDSVHGLDAVYLRRPRRGRVTVVVVENKVNGSKYNPDQLSDSTLRRQCERMQSSPDDGVWKTSSIILAAMQGHEDYVLERLLMRHDLVAGVTTRVRVGSNGKVIPLSSRKKNVANRLRKILEGRVAKGQYKRHA